MNRTVLTFAFSFLFSTTLLHAQAPGDEYAKTDAFVRSLGSLDNLNVATIADTITRKLDAKKDKARAIFYWIANNISLDLKASKANDNRKTDPILVVQSRKATPLGFSTLVQEMCSMANIRCLTVDGYVKNYAEEINNPADEINHSWNVVQLGQSPEDWYYIDAAKASGYADKKYSTFTKEFTSGYFFADKTLFNLDHYPDNQAWQLGAGPKSLKEFYALPVISSAAYVYGLQKPLPLNGYIKTKMKTPASFGFRQSGDVPITSITLIIGDDKKPDKPLDMNFVDNGGAISFKHQFKKEDVYPVKIVVDGKVLLQYMAEVTE
jgi:hypothetical protein